MRKRRVPFVELLDFRWLLSGGSISDPTVPVPPPMPPVEPTPAPEPSPGPYPGPNTPLPPLPIPDGGPVGPA